MIFCTLRKLINEKNVTQSKIADTTGITRPTLLQLIRNDNQNIKYDTLEKLCDFFKIPLDELLIYSPFNLYFGNSDVSKIFVDDKISDISLELDLYIDSKLYRFEYYYENIHEHLIDSDIILYCEISRLDYLNLNQFGIENVINNFSKVNEDFLEFEEFIFDEINEFLISKKKKINIKLQFKIIDTYNNEKEIKALIDKLPNDKRMNLIAELVRERNSNLINWNKGE